MPLTPEQIAAAGPWVTVVFVLLAILVAAATAFVRGWIVPGWLYDRLEARAQKAETQAERNAEALEGQAKAFEVMGRSFDRLERDFDRLAPGRVND